MGEQTSELEKLERIFTDTTAEPIKISYVAIKYITENFAQEIGRGGFGVVYLGSLQNVLVAVKKLFKEYPDKKQKKDNSDDKFLDEVKCLKKVNHSNIVRFIGYCVDTPGEIMEVEGKPRIVEVQQRLLCFEYIPNGNLHSYLKDKTYGYEWNVRYQIIKGICEGLHHIHQKGIHHYDLKPANVLLGANMEPKITDFGLSRCIDEEQGTMVTLDFFGTLGYIAPELIYNKKRSSKSDIFSLGIVMINLLTGRTGGIIENCHETIHADCSQMKSCIEIAQSCVDKDPHKRPTTGEIIHSLNETETLIEKDSSIINEPINDPGSSLYQVVQSFQALPDVALQGHRRVDTLYVELDVPEGLLEGSERPSKLPYQLFLFITENFAEERKIGQGAYAVVYMGILRQRKVAVKRLREMAFDNDRMFHEEVKIMMLANQHKNIVKLLGYCSNMEEEMIEYDGRLIMVQRQLRMICLEYARNGSLRHHLSDAYSGHDWGVRYQIIKGICDGMHYLHGKHIVHLDIKPENIVLDDNMVPKNL